MALQKTTAYFPFAKGPDTKTDPKQVVVGKLLTLQNGYFQTPGMIRKRPGFPLLGTNGFGSATGLATFRNDLVSMSTAGVSTFSPTLGSSNTRTNHYRPVSIQTWASMALGDFGASGADITVHPAGYYAVSSAGYQYTIYDLATQTAVATSGLPGYLQVKSFAIGNYIVFLLVDSVNGLYYSAFDVTTGTPSGGVLIDAAAANRVFDACLLGGTLYIAYANGSGITLRSLTSSLVLSSAHTVASVPFATLTIYPSAQNSELHVACSDASSTVKVFGYSTNLTTQVIAPQAVATLPGAQSTMRLAGYSITTAASGTGNLLFETGGHVWTVSYTSSSAGSVQIFAANAQLGSKVFNVGTISQGGYIFVQNISASAGGVPQQATRFLVQTANYQNQGTMIPLLKLAPETAYQANRPYSAPGEVSQAASGAYLHAYYQETSASGTYGIQAAQFTFSGAPQAVELGNNLHLSGGVLWMYDGQDVVEHGFHVYPEITATTGSGGGLSAGSYQYVAVYQWTDAQGNVHQSAPSLPQTFTATAGQKGVVTVPPLAFTAKNTSTNLEAYIYRTQANGTIFYQVNVVPVSVQVSGWTVTNQTVNDTQSDSAIAGNRQLYTTGGEVENYATPAILSMTTYKGRLCAIPADSPQQFWFSKQVLPGSPVEMSLFFTQTFDSRGGNGTAVASMDDKLIVFKQSAIFAIVGDGPSPNGQNNDFTTGQLIATDVGTTNAASVVLTPLGIMFQSAKGISLLDRSLSTENYVGAPVEGYLQNTTVVSAVLYPAFNQVRFQLASGTTLVFDYLVGEWSVFTNPAGVQATVWRGLYTYVTASGQILQESASVFTDNGTFYPLLIQTSWLSFAGIQGYQRVREALILGDWKSAHTLQVQVAYDFVPTPSQTTQISAGTSVAPYQFRVLLDRQKCEALSFTIQDSQTAPYGEGMDLSGMAFELAVKGGPARVSQSQTNR